MDTVSLLPTLVVPCGYVRLSSPSARSSLSSELSLRTNFQKNNHLVYEPRKLSHKLYGRKHFGSHYISISLDRRFTKEEYTIGAMKITLFTSGAKHFQKLKILQSNFFIFVYRQISWGNKTKLFQHKSSSLIVYVETDHQHKRAVLFSLFYGDERNTHHF